MTDTTGPRLTHTAPDGWHWEPPQPCAGVWTSASGLIRTKRDSKPPGSWKPPRCCEVHLMPWGHLSPGATQ